LNNIAVIWDHPLNAKQIFNTLIFCLLFGVSSAHLANAQAHPDMQACHRGAELGDFSSPEEAAEAIEACSRILDRGARNSIEVRVTAYRSRAWAFFMTSNRELSLSDYSSAIELAPKDSRLYTFRGMLHQDHGFEDLAFDDYSRAIELSPTDWMPLSFRGNLYVKRGEFDTALIDYTSASELFGRLGYVRARGNVNFIVGNYDSAVRDFSFQRSRMPSNDHAALWLYIVQRRSGYAHAEAELQKNATTIDSPNRSILIDQLFLLNNPAAIKQINHLRDCKSQFFLGQWHMIQGDLDFGRLALELAVDFCSNELTQRPSNHWMISAAQADIGRISKINSIFEGQASNSTETNAYQELKRIDNQLENNADISVIQRASAFAERAGLHLAWRNYDQAIVDLDEAIRFNPNYEHFYARCDAHALNKQYGIALSDCSRALGITRHTEAYRRLGIIHLALGDYDQAVANFEILKRNSQRDREASSLLHIARARNGEVEPVQGIKTLVRGLKKDNPQRALLEFLRHNRLPSQVLPEFDRCSAMLYTGQWHILRADRDRARVALEKAVNVHCDPETDQYRLARSDLDQIGTVVDTIATHKKRIDEDRHRKIRDDHKRADRFQKMVVDQKAFLARDGQPYFSFELINRAWGFVNHGCLIGGDGEVFTFGYKVAFTGIWLALVIVSWNPFKRLMKG